MPGSDDDALQQQPAAWVAARTVRLLIAVIVVLGAAGTGFLASRIWPLRTSSGPGLPVASASTAKAVEPMLLPVVAPREAKVAEPAVSVASRAPVEPSHPQAPTISANEPPSNPSDLAQNTASVSVAALDERTAEPSTDTEKGSPKAEPPASKTERAEAARRQTADKEKPSRVAQGRRNRVSGPKIAKSATAGVTVRPDPVLKEFMSTPMRF